MKKTGSERGDSPLIEGFPPILGDNPKVLILGSMPSVRSLEKHEYYGHPRNRFWPLMLRLLSGHKEEMSYEERTELVKRSRIAIWDSIAVCRRNGSLDSDIADARPNPVDRLVESCPSIEWVFFNGREAERVFRQAFPSKAQGEGGLRFACLPSTSPANAAWSFEKLADAWGEALQNTGVKVIR